MLQIKALKYLPNCEVLDRATKSRQEVDYWENLIKKSLNAKGSERLSIIKEISDNQTIRKYNPQVYGESLKILGKSSELDDSDYSEYLDVAFTEGNGAAYHVGCRMFETVKDSGIDVRDVATKHPNHLFRLYEGITGKNILKS